jgi:sugar lactone lactonase YvrE
MRAATSTAWEVSGFNDFLKGRLNGLSLDANGRLQAGLSTRWTASLGQPAFWGMTVAADGMIYAATGHNGKIFRISPDGKQSVVWSSQQSEIFAICFDSAGVLYAGTSPNGGLYRIRNGAADEVWHSATRYIWSLEPGPDGSIYIGTGQAGRVYRYDGKSKTDVYYDTGQLNVTSIAGGPNGHLYAGTDPNGLLYDISGARHATVLYDSSLPEIRAIVVNSEGTIYAAAMGGAVPARMNPTTPSAPATTPTAVATSPTVITVTAAKENGVPADADGDQAAKTSDQSRSGIASTPSTTPASTASTTEVSGVEKSAIYRIRTNGAIETLRSSKDDNVYALLLDGTGLLFSTDDHGRVYRWEDGRSSLLSEPGSGETTQLLKIGDRLYAAVSNSARLISFGPPGGLPGFYESQVHDATSVARWGHFQWHGTGNGVVFRTRTGYAARPDGTWSAWSGPITNQSDSLIKSPAARFIQFRAEWPAGSDARINTIDVPYLSQNSAPVIRSVTVSSVAGTNAAKTGASPPSASSAYSITVTDTGEAPAASSATSSSQIASRLQTTQTQISWQADDPDSDKLVYSVYFRAEDENGWQTIRSHMFENTLLLDPDVFADGRYFFRVVASDAPSNAPQFAQQAELISTPVLIDNTPPVVTLGKQQRNGGSAELELEAVDKTSPLRLCEYSLDAGNWQPIESEDGITDSPQERFHVHLDRLGTGEHLLVIRVYDVAGNAGLAKTVLR